MEASAAEKDGSSFSEFLKKPVPTTVSRGTPFSSCPSCCRFTSQFCLPICVGGSDETLSLVEAVWLAFLSFPYSHQKIFSLFHGREGGLL